MKILALVFFLFTLCVRVDAAPLSGAVQSVNGDMALVAMAGDVMPPVGAKAEIYFKLAGVDEEISVATGSALQIEKGELRVKIENATGSVKKGQLVRFAASTSTPPATEKSFTVPSNKPLAFKRAIIGEWKQTFEDALIIFEDDGRLRTNEKGGEYSAKYRLDTAATPPRVELYDFDNPAAAPPGGRVRGIFQVDGNQLKLQLAEDDKDWPAAFSDDALTGTRVGEAATTNAIVGKWRRNIPITNLYTFTNDGAVRTYYQTPGVTPDAKEYHYQLDDSTSPARINFFFDKVDGDPDFRGIVEFDSNDRLRLEGKWTKEEKERPQTFGKDTNEFARTR